MTAKEYLSQAHLLDCIINSHVEEVERLKRLAESMPTTRFDKERVKGGQQTQSKMADIVLKYVDMERQINEEIDQYICLKQEIRDTINAVEDNRYKTLLTYKYLLRYTLIQVAELMNYSIPQTKRLHRQALAAVKVPDNKHDTK